MEKATILNFSYFHNVGLCRLIFNMNMKNSIKTILFILMLFFIGSCEKVTLEPEEFNFNDPVSFEQDIIAIFDSKCITCHNGSRDPDLRSENAYQSLVSEGLVNRTAPEQSELYKKLLGTHDARATEIEKNTILAWIKQGALEN